MKTEKAGYLLFGFIVVVAMGVTVSGASGQTETLRIVTYNIEADINGVTTPRPGLISSASGPVTNAGVLEGIGEEQLGSNNNAQPLDILALQETTSNSTTVAPIVSNLNSYYNSAGMYAQSSVQGTESGNDPSSGNGPNAIVYNTHTLQLVASLGIGTPSGSSNGEYRQVMRYEFAPAGETLTPSDEFYLYVSHYKSGTTSSDLTSRGKEATIIRNDSATLPSSARILYVGDYNVSTSGEQSYQTIIGSGTNQGVDPLNTSGVNNIDWTTNSLLSEKTESASSLRYRDDFEVMTNNIYSDSAGGLELVPNTYHVFGNNGTTPFQSGVNSGSNTALNDLAPGSPLTASVLLQDLSTASDHYPVVADFMLAVPEPSSVVLSAIGCLLLSAGAWASNRF